MSPGFAAAPVAVLAHGGGAPEALTFGAPVLVLLVFSVMERRARAREREQDRDE